MTSEDYQELKDKVAALVTETGQMDDRERDFVNQTRDRLEKYEDKTFMSVKQLDWLEKLYTKYA